MRPYFLCYLLLFSLSLTNLAYAQDMRYVKVRKPTADAQFAERFLVDAVTLFIAKLPEQQKLFQIEQVEITDKQLMNFESYLERGFFDVNYFGTSERLEQSFLPIRIPLFAGLLGHRVSIVKEKNLTLLRNADIKQLKALPLCQGSIWADSDILEHNGFSVLRVSHYEFILKMLDADRCVYFPRGIFEGEFELSVLKERFADFTLVDDPIIYYPFPAYLFVRKDDVELAQALQLGFERALADGSYRTLLEQHPLTHKLFPLKKWQNKRFIYLDNPNLPEKTPLDNPAYWLKLNP